MVNAPFVIERVSLNEKPALLPWILNKVLNSSILLLSRCFSKLSHFIESSDLPTSLKASWRVVLKQFQVSVRFPAVEKFPECTVSSKGMHFSSSSVAKHKRSSLRPCCRCHF